MAHEPFQSWKHSPPASSKEEVAADLLKQVGEADTLSPQAMNRIERSLRQARPRPFWLGNLGLATAAVGGLAVALVVLVTVRRASLPASSVARLAASDTRAEQTLALNDRPPPPEAEPAEAQPAEAHRAETKSRRQQPADEKFSAPPPAWAGKSAKKEAQRPAALERGLGEAEPSAESFAERSHRGEGLAAPNTRLDVAAGAAAPAAASAALEDARPMKAAAPDQESRLECQDEIAKASVVLAGSSGDMEHALYSRGTCRLRLGLRAAAIQDFEDYLRRFPNGRFAPGIRASLANLRAH
jgi:hypothetical protein